MKKVCMLFAVAMLATAAMAETNLHLNIEAGYDHGIISHSEAVDFHSNTLKNQDTTVFLGAANGFHVGPTMQIDFLSGHNIPSLTIGLHYQFLGTPASFYSTKDQIKTYKTTRDDAKNAGGIASVNSYRHSLQIPVSARYTHEFDNNMHLFVYVGPQLDLILSEKTITRAYIDKNGNTGATSSVDVISGKSKSKTYLNGEEVGSSSTTIDKEDRAYWADLGVNMGFGFGYKDFSLVLGYKQGFLPRNKDTHETLAGVDYYNIMLNGDLKLTLSYRIF